MADNKGPEEIAKLVMDEAAKEGQDGGLEPRVLVRKPGAVDPSWIEAEMVDECFHLDQLGDSRLLVHFFKNRYLRDNTLAGEKDPFSHIYRWIGSHWEMDIQGNWLKDFMTLLGEVYRLRAEEFLAQLKEIAQNAIGRSDLDFVRAWLKGKDAPEKPAALLKKAEAYVARGKKCLAVARVRHVAHLAFSGDGSLGFGGKSAGRQWNSDPRLLPCRNGTLDLGSLTLRESRPEDFFNKCLDWEYDALADCPLWKETVRRFLCGDEELIYYFGCALGVAMTGYQTKDFFVMWGPKANNGKSVIFEAVGLLLGPFAATIEVDILLRQPRKSPGAPHPELLKMMGVRAAVTSEADEVDYFDAGRVKALVSGGDEISVRTLNKDVYHSFKPTHTLFIHTNDLPRLSGLDRGLVSRMKVIPCRAGFIDASAGPEEPDKFIYHARDRAEIMNGFRKEISGILAWVAAFAQEVLLNKRALPPPPPLVVEASEDYEAEQDILGQFIEAKCIKDEGFKVGGLELYNAFKEWCEEDRGMQAKEIMTSTRFGRKIKVHLRHERVKGGRVYLDVRIDRSRLI